MVLVWIALVLGVDAYITNKSAIGRHLNAVGGNENGTALSGVKIRSVYRFAYARVCRDSPGEVSACLGRRHPHHPDVGHGDHSVVQLHHRTNHGGPTFLCGRRQHRGGASTPARSCTLLGNGLLSAIKPSGRRRRVRRPSDCIRIDRLFRSGGELSIAKCNLAEENVPKPLST